MEINAWLNLNLLCSREHFIMEINEISKYQPDEKKTNYIYSELDIAKKSATFTCIMVADPKTGLGVGKL
jgi:protein associated with RNAse G/E